MMMMIIMYLFVLLSLCSSVSNAWIPTSNSVIRSSLTQHSQLQRTYYYWRNAQLQQSASALEPLATTADDDEYEYIEDESWPEADFVGSEWLVGTLWNGDKNIKETWVRLSRNEDGKNICYWGTDKKGTWNLDVASQFLSISQETIFGKEIWACTVDDYYFLQGTVRGWAYWKAASVLGQWQGKRLGVDPEEAGAAPWFAGKSTEGSTESESSSESSMDDKE
jgi:hypothetical protein